MTDFAREQSFLAVFISKLLKIDSIMCDADFFALVCAVAAFLLDKDQEKVSASDSLISDP